MKLPDKLKPQFCCSKDPTRYILQFAYVKNGMIASTNGRMMVAALIEEDEWKEDVTDKALIPVSALKVATKKRKGSQSYCQGVIGLMDGDIVKARDSLDETRLIKTSDEVDKFPNIGKVAPSELVGLKSITLNAKMLWELAQALGTEGVTLSFNQDSKEAIIVQAINKDERIGLIMPIRATSSVIRDNKAFKKLLAMKEETAKSKE